VLSLDWDRRRRITPAGAKSQEAWPGAEPGCESPGESRCGAPEGERAPTLARFRARAHASGDTRLRCADIGWMRLSVLRSPRLFPRDARNFRHADQNSGAFASRDDLFLRHCEQSEGSHVARLFPTRHSPPGFERMYNTERNAVTLTLEKTRYQPDGAQQTAPAQGGSS
jgi:hypothetical protein